VLFYSGEVNGLMTSTEDPQQITQYEQTQLVA